jgi:hypothetical protein
MAINGLQIVKNAGLFRSGDVLRVSKSLFAVKIPEYFTASFGHGLAKFVLLVFEAQSGDGRDPLQF